MADIKTIANYLKENYGIWGWLGQRAHDACCINSILPFDFIVSCDNGKEREVFFEGRMFSVEKADSVRRDWSNEDIKTSLKGQLGRELLDYLKQREGKANLLCYRSIEQLENPDNEISSRVRIYAAAEKLKNMFDNKIFFYENLPVLGLERIPGKVSSAGQCSFEELADDLGVPFVLQYPFGSSGHFTFIVKNTRLFEDLKNRFGDEPVIARKYIDGYSLNVNGLIIKKEGKADVLCTAPSVQLTGIPECSSFPSAFCGNDYTAATHLDGAVVAQVEKYVKTVGMWMAGSGFSGIFGMDFVVEADRVYPVEINPRFQNSTSLFTCACEKASHPGAALSLLHIASFLPEDRVMKRFSDSFGTRDMMGGVKGSQVILHNIENKDVITGDIRPGVYAFNGDDLGFVRSGASLGSCDSDKEYLVTCAVPYGGTVVKPNAPICKVQALNSLVDRRGMNKLTDEAGKAIKLVYKMLDLRVAHEIRTN